MVLNKIISIQRLDNDAEVWSNYFTTHAQINKASGKEYFNASTNITASTYNFKVRYCNALEDIMFNTSLYRIVYDNRIFDIVNVDNFMLKNHELTLVGDYVGEHDKH